MTTTIFGHDHFSSIYVWLSGISISWISFNAIIKIQFGSKFNKIKLTIKLPML